MASLLEALALSQSESVGLRGRAEVIGNDVITESGEGKQLVGAGQMKDRNSSNLSAELDDNQGAMEAAQALRDSSLSLSLNRHNRGSILVAGVGSVSGFEWVVCSGSPSLLQ
ncbi:hypothetical protein EYF80_001686 [Liparis tanakae]|uniref:Uncharacterized protein n=1 Tax=Liparis tanakae TaxID=230148 RepID=A0A4Z2JCT5_9TELE|nr:hypothetical protein EYF80_001686 [Liparis tanakae]